MRVFEAAQMLPRGRVKGGEDYQGVLKLLGRNFSRMRDSIPDRPNAAEGSCMIIDEVSLNFAQMSVAQCRPPPTTARL